MYPVVCGCRSAPGRVTDLLCTSKGFCQSPPLTGYQRCVTPTSCSRLFKTRLKHGFPGRLVPAGEASPGVERLELRGGHHAALSFDGGVARSVEPRHLIINYQIDHPTGRGKHSK